MADKANVTPDPFALRAHVLHSALAQNQVIGADINPDLFDKFFQSPAFCAWSTSITSWQLHCYGEPGCGKTTLAAVATSRLHHELNGARTAIASISISEHVALGDEYSDEFTEYQLACEEGKPVVERIQKLGTTLSNASPDTCKYLILDGYDRINEALQSVIDFQLSLLQTSGVKVMTTRRVPVFSAPHNARHVSVKLGDFPLEDFITEKIKMYHYDVGPDVGRQIVEYIKSKVGGNVTLALLYLEDIFMQDDFSFFNADQVDDRLPRDVIAFFDAEMKFIECRPEPQGLLSLLAIAAAAHNHHGISLVKLEECIRLAQSTCRNLDYPRGVEDVFNAANGWLTDPRTINREVDICCKPAFTLYVQENYNESLTWTKRQLGYDTEYEAAVTTSEQLLETPRLLGSTFDTLDSGTAVSTPPGSIDNALGLLGSKRMLNSPLYVGKEEGLIQSPSRMDSTENVSSLTLPVQLNELSLSSTTEPALPPRQSKKAICDFCTRHVLGSGASSGQHHVSAHDAEMSMDRCIFCSLLYSTDSTGELSSSRQAWPLYHWAFRTLPRGRELKGSMILRFWSTQPTLVSKSFRFFPGNDFHIPSSNELQHSTDPKESGGYQIKEWMETCTRHHAGCSKNPDDKRPGASFLPTRLIDVDTGDENVVRLIETKITKVKGPYCTLSHAWGPPEKKFLTTTVWNMAKHLLNGIKMSELPPNFQQAIEITRFLKIRYIWIDSLVIVQEPYGDFVKEGDLMHKVYRYSYCNIVAADSSDGYGGLFRKRDPHAVLPVEFRATEATYGLGKKAWTIVPADLWERELLNSFIYTRGWVFQERMLSPRILHFTKHQIFWDCNTLSACEAFPTGLPLHLDKKASTDRHWRGRLDQSQISSRALCGANDDESSYTFWMSAVQNYTDCNLTNQGDKTVAIWSVAKLLRDISSEEYVVGMWSTFLEEQLAWRVRDIDRSERFPELQIDIPSWSWASIKGPILPQHRLAMRSYKVKNHKGGDVSFTIEPITSPDTEPKLRSKALDIAGYINNGNIVAANDGYRLEVLIGSKGSIHLDAFPDEPLASTSIESNQCEFVILAASISNTTKSHIPGDTPFPKTYSGIGLLLTKRSLWYEHQAERFRAFREGCGDLTSLREPKWRMDAFEKLMLQRPNTEEGLVYRRMGAVHFRDLDQRAYGWLQQGQPLKFWIE